MPVNITDFFKRLSLKQTVSILFKGLRCGYVLLSPSLTAWLAHRAASKGAAVAFYTLFSMTPILVLTIAVAGYFFGAEAAQGEIIAQMQALVGPNGAQAINAVLAAARNSESGVIASVIATLLLLLGATIGCRNKSICSSYVYPAFWLPILSKKAWRFLRTV
jgi:membrane protein